MMREYVCPNSCFTFSNASIWAWRFSGLLKSVKGAFLNGVAARDVTLSIIFAKITHSFVARLLVSLIVPHHQARFHPPQDESGMQRPGLCIPDSSCGD